MEFLKKVAHIHGKNGLFLILKVARNGVIVESLDSMKQKSLVTNQNSVSTLGDISIFVDDDSEADSIALSEVFRNVFVHHDKTINLTPKTMNDKDLLFFLEEVLPNFDRRKVYPSDVKKMINWYKILIQFSGDFQNEKELEQKVIA